MVKLLESLAFIEPSEVSEKPIFVISNLCTLADRAQHDMSNASKEQRPGVLTQNFYKWRKCSLNLWKNDFKNSS